MTTNLHPHGGVQLRFRTVHYDFNRHWDVFVGARFPDLTDLTQSIGGRTAQLDPSITVYATAGISWKF